MIIKTYDLKLESREGYITYHDITQQIKDLLEQTGIKHGQCSVVSTHTTCSVIFEESSYDKGYRGYDYLQMDLNNILEKIVPKCINENQYYHPGPEHIRVGLEEWGGKISPEAFTMLNTDAHIRSSLLGTSETFIVQQGELQIGLVGYIYFIDWDQNRKRTRTCKVQFIGV